MLNKRGQGLSTSTIVLLILAVVVLVVLVIGFTMGWSKLAPWLSSSNVDTIANSCAIACSTNNVYDFCTLERTLKAENLPGNVNEVKNNCEFFATTEGYKGVYGIAECSGLCSGTAE